MPKKSNADEWGFDFIHPDKIDCWKEPSEFWPNTISIILASICIASTIRTVYLVTQILTKATETQ